MENRIICCFILVCFNIVSIHSFVVNQPAQPSAHFPNRRLQHQQQSRQYSTSITIRKPSPSVAALSMIGGIGEAWAAYNVALEENPLLVKSITAGVILGAADLTGQFVETKLKNNKNNNNNNDTDEQTTVDWARVGRFAVFGLVLQAPWNHFYYLLLDGVLPPTPEPWTATTAIKVVIDQFVQAPIFTVIIFIFLGTLEGKGRDAIQKQLRDDYTDTMLANWKLWLPATVINIAFVPPMLRVLYLNAVFFFWCIFLSVQLNKEESSPDTESSMALSNSNDEAEITPLANEKQYAEIDD